VVEDEDIVEVLDEPPSGLLGPDAAPLLWAELNPE
jgi:hypothetical protein